MVVVINSVVNFYRYMYAIYVHCRKYTFICANLETCILANISDKFSGMLRNSKCNWVYHAMSKGELELPNCTEKSKTRNRSNCPQ